MLWSTEELFSQFGPSRYGRPRRATDLSLPEDFAAVRSLLRQSCPSEPGIYGMIDTVGRLVYVGMSRNLRTRLLTYFQQSQHRVRKESRIAQRACRVRWEPTGHELLAQLREFELIRRFLPELNVRDRRTRQSVYLYITTGDAPKFKLGTQMPKWCHTFWGPLERRFLKKGVDVLNRQFLLADCLQEVAMHFSDEGSLIPLEHQPRCLRGEMRQCLAPCAERVSRNRYMEQLKLAIGFLQGYEQGPLVELDQAMQRAVGLRRFELAARLRDTRETLIELRERLQPRPDVLPSSFVYSLCRGRRWHWMAVERGLLRRVAPAPSTKQSMATWNSFWQSSPDQRDQNNGMRLAAERRILTTWFHRHPEELDKVIDLPTARRLSEDINNPR